ncbi:MAG: efflux RND transporter periplasmic adaptor subunit [Candidatus Tantalella remota]|nr:efflux RND transporter periplasmic adaptor subunit [Candidatus Tantalella remota]
MASNNDMKNLQEKVLKYAKANKRILKLIGTLLLVMIITSHIRGCQIRNHKAPVQPRPVHTALAFKKTVPIYVDSFGTLSSPENVDIKAQVTGKILEVNFTQGQEVKKGDLLFTIDPKEYKAEVDKAEGALAESVEDLKLKTDTFERNKQLFEKELISAQDFDTYKTDMSAAAAATQFNAAELEMAKINLEYCYISSPINGLTGKRQVDLGNIVPANTGPVLVNVKRVDELYLDFTLPERDLDKVRKAMKEGTLTVEITVPGEKDKKYEGKLEFIDNTVDDATGTFALRAIVKNGGRALWSGQFVDVRLILGSETAAVLVPYEAAQIGKNGYYVFAVGKKNKADLRLVTVGSRQGDSIVIEKGVEDGEKVVTEGQLGLSNGIPVVDMAKYEKKDKKKKEKKSDQ